MIARFAALSALLVAPALTSAQTIDVPAAADAWQASDSIRFESYLGRQAIYINRGVALARNVTMRSGTIEFDWAATPRTNFLGVSFHAKALDNSEAVFFRIGASGTSEAVQYGPALNTYGVAWQVYHGEGANAVAQLQRERWTHVRVAVNGDVARVYLDNSAEPLLTVPTLAGVSGTGVGLWAGNFGRGAYFSNFRVTPSPNASASSAPVTAPRGTVTAWELSQAIDAPTLKPGVLPTSLTWERITPEPTGLVLINRYRVTPIAGVPTDSAGVTLADSVMGGRVRGTKVVFARTTIRSDGDATRRMQFSYSDGVVIYANGKPLYFGMNPQGLRDDLGIMSPGGDAVYVPLKRGRNEIIFAVTEYSGGWAFWARLDDR